MGCIFSKIRKDVSDIEVLNYTPPLCEAPLQTGYFCRAFSRLQSVNGKKTILLTSAYP